MIFLYVDFTMDSIFSYVYTDPLVTYYFTLNDDGLLYFTGRIIAC